MYSTYRQISKESWDKDRLYGAEQEHPIEPCKCRLGMFEKSPGCIPGLDQEDKEIWIRIVEISRKRVLLFGLLSILLLGGIGGFLFQMFRPSQDTPIKIHAGEMVNPNPANIRLPGIDKIYADSGDVHVEQLLLNVEGNAYNLQYTITLDQTGEELYQSKVIPPGYGVKEFDMSQSFQKGEYPISITVNSSAAEDQEKSTDRVAYNAGKLKATLVVE